MWTRCTQDMGVRPAVFTTAEANRRADQLLRTPHVQRLARGVWCRHPEPLGTVQRNLLLSSILGTAESPVPMTGFPALTFFELPVGPEFSWTRVAISAADSYGVVGQPRCSAWRQPAALTRQRGRMTLQHMSALPHVAWSGQRLQHRGADFRVSKGLGLPSIVAPWGGSVVHPVEALAVASPFLARWRMIACLDALLTYHFRITGTGVHGSSSREDVARVIGSLPQRSARTLALQRALRDARAPVLSPFETLTRLVVLAGGLPEPITNQHVRIGGHDFYVDLAWVEAKVGIEYNGSVHSAGHSHYKNERYRSSLLRANGWDLYEITADDLAGHIRRTELLNGLRRSLIKRNAM